MRYPRRRDDNEPSIVKALTGAGASVERLDVTGVPDLLVGYDGRTYLIEVKQEHGRAGLGMKKTASGLRESQEKWWQKWLGAMPVVATTADEALAAIGATS